MVHRQVAAHRRAGRAAGSVAAGLCAAAVLLAGPAASQQEPNPRLAPPPSRLGRPYEAPVLLVGHAAVGGGLHEAWSSGRVGYGGALVFRPASAANFLDFLYDWNAGGVLQVEQQHLGPEDEVLALDGIVRRYFGDRGDGDTEVMRFAGAGAGVARFSVPGTAGAESDRYLCSVFEVGQEWLVDGRGYFFVKGQFRYHLHRGRNYRVWSVQAGAGIPYPF